MNIERHYRAAAKPEVWAAPQRWQSSSATGFWAHRPARAAGNVGPLVVVMVLAVALLITYPWILLISVTLAYLVSLPFGWVSYRAYERRSHENKVEAAPAATAGPAPGATGVVPSSENNERPLRLS